MWYVRTEGRAKACVRTILLCVEQEWEMGATSSQYYTIYSAFG